MNITWFSWVFFTTCLVLHPSFCAIFQKVSTRAVPGRALGRFDFVERFEYEGHQYFFHLEPRSWEQAVEFCQRDGGYLAALEDAYEVNFVSHAMSGHLCTKTVFQNIWIGGRFFPDANRWLWDATGYEIIGKPGDKHYPPWTLSNEPGLDCVNLEQNVDEKAQFVNVDCDRKRRFLCERGCPKLYNTDRGHWNPDSCLLDPPTKGDVCQMTCGAGLELFGANPLNCAGHGWNNSIGINVIPDCKSPEEIAEGIVEQLDMALDGKDAFMIFVLDDAVDVVEFELQKRMIAQLIKIFPPTASQAVNVVSGGQPPQLLIQGTSNQSLCHVLRAVENIEQTRGPKTDRGSALQAVQKLALNHQDKVPVIVMIAGTSSSSKEVLNTASAIKHNAGIIFTIGFGSFNEEELITMSSASLDGLLYYRISNPGNFERVCQRLEQVSDFDNSNCENHVDAVEIFIEKLNKSLAKNTNLLFLLNESTLWGHELLDYALQFIQSITLAFPLSRSRQAGLIAMHPAPNVAIPFKEDDSCGFNRHVAKISSGSGFENHGNGFLDVADLALLEAKRVNATGKTAIVVLCECNDHELENDLRFSVGEVLVVKFNGDCWGRSSLDLSSGEKRKRVLRHLMDIPHDDCTTVCPGLQADERGFWDEENCTLSAKLGQKCTFTCHEAYELIGSKLLICTEFGWEGTAGDDVLPHCKTPEEIADAFVGKLSGILDNNVDSNFLFVLDESGSVRLENFKTEIEFVDAVVDAFPLSGHRVAGLLTFSNEVRNLISLRTADTCRFIRQTKRVDYLGGGTDIHKALVKANYIIEKRAVHPQTLVFLITDGISQSDPSRAAKELRDNGVVLFIIGVAGYKQEQLEPLASSGPDGTANFYGVKSFEVFNQISKYLNQTYHAEGVQCRT